MTTPKQLPQAHRFITSKCPKSRSGQHRFHGFPRGTRACVFCGVPEKDVKEEANANNG